MIDSKIEDENNADYSSHAISFTAALGSGIWAPLQPDDASLIAEKIKAKNPIDRFKIIALNFWKYADIETYKNM